MSAQYSAPFNFYKICWKTKSYICKCVMISLLFISIIPIYWSNFIFISSQLLGCSSLNNYPKYSFPYSHLYFRNKIKTVITTWPSTLCAQNYSLPPSMQSLHWLQTHHFFSVVRHFRCVVAQDVQWSSQTLSHNYEILHTDGDQKTFSWMRHCPQNYKILCSILSLFSIQWAKLYAISCASR